MSNRIMTRRGIATVVAMIGLCGDAASDIGTGGRPLPKHGISTRSSTSSTMRGRLPVDDVATLREALARAERAEEALRQERARRVQDREIQNVNTLAWKTKAEKYKAIVKGGPTPHLAKPQNIEAKIKRQEEEIKKLRDLLKAKDAEIKRIQLTTRQQQQLEERL